jgi:amino acid adenylation domain-containing protein/thioester reductase-like protein
VTALEDNVIYYPLTHPQKGIWYTEKLYPGTSIGNIAATLKLKYKVDYDILAQTINLIIKDNDAFRLRFIERNGEPLQYISEYEYRKIDFFDFSNTGIEALYNWDSKHVQTPFPLVDSDLIYFAILKINENEFGVYSKMHHLVCDGWTMVQLGNLIQNYYYRIQNGQEIVKKESYISFMKGEEQYLKSERFQKDKIYWESKFDSVFELTSLKNSIYRKDIKAKRKTFVIPNKFSLKIRNYCKENNASIFSLFVAALCMYINRVTSKEDIIIGVPVLNRTNSQEKNTSGMFVSTIPLRAYVRDEMTFGEFSSDITNQWYSALRHQRYPFDLIAKKVREYNKSMDKLYDISLSYQNAKLVKDGDVNKEEGRWHFNGYQTESLYIHVNDREDDGNIILDLDYHSDLFNAKEVEFIYDHIIRLLWHALDNPKRQIGFIEMISEREKQKILFDFNNTSAEYNSGKTIQELFEEQVVKTPDKTALIFEDQSITYSELNRKANDLALYLRRIGAKQNTIIGIVIRRSLEMFISILAVLKSGGAYLPIDPEYPENRIYDMLSDSNAAIILTGKLRLKVPPNIKTIINVFDFEFSGRNHSNPSITNKSKDAAYLIYTSGSTGKPKGVVIEHKSVVNFIDGMAKIIDFSSDKTILSLTTVCFDIFVLESLLPLARGMKIVIANEQQQKIPKLLCEIIEKNNVNVLQITPSRLQLLLVSLSPNHYFTSLTDILVGGETFPEAILGRILSLSGANLYNVYGPTETTVWSTVKKITDKGTINIGRPIQNTKVYILDKNLNIVPIGIPGEMYIGGDGVARGYHNRSELNKLKFIDNPFVKNEKIYRTGDLARFYPQGEIQHMGRIDNQIKINGFRIELGEIEQRILAYKNVKEAAVTNKFRKNGKAYLCAYVVSDKELDFSDLKSHLLMELPYYMIPTSFVRLDSIPTTPNGKIDRNSLPEANDETGLKTKSKVSRNDVDKKLINAWSKVFKDENVDINDNFFDMGGDSLMIIQLQAILLNYGICINTQDVYQYQTIKELSDMIRLKDNADKKIETLVNVRDTNILDDQEIRYVRFENILLTGSTGFLGIHILESVIRNSSSNVYCLIRGESSISVQNRLRNRMQFYGMDHLEKEIDNRIHIINGDISESNLGLHSEMYSKMLSKIDLVLNCAALVKHYGFYNEFYKTNVAGTKNIINFCMKGNIVLHQISTINISGNYLVDNGCKIEGFSENDSYVGQSYKDNVYVRSKFEAEQIIFKKVEKGLRAAIHRVGILTGRSSDGMFQKNIEDSGFYRRIKSIIAYGMVPSSVSKQRIEFTPVDYCGNAIRKLLSVEIQKCRIYHIYNHNLFTIGKFVEAINKRGFRVVFTHDDNFMKSISSIIEIEGNQVLEGISNDMKSNKLQYESQFYIDSTQTLSALKNLDFFWPNIDQTYIDKLIHYMIRSGFLDNIKETIYDQEEQMV